jgi:ABC-type Fe3+-hydroxamate transport system substrate-binding protein
MNIKNTVTLFKKMPFVSAPLLVLISLAVMLLPLDEKEAVSKTSGEVKRIVSLTPAITRQIIDLESEHLLVGVTSYHPPLTRKIKIVGTLVRPNIEEIVILKPDMVFISDEDNVVQFVEMLKATDITVHRFGRNLSFDSICENYLELASIIQKRELAEKKLKEYRKRLDSITLDGSKPSVALLVSNTPLVGVSDVTYIGKVINDAGGRNSMKLLTRPYPKLSLEHLVKLDPDIIISILYHTGTNNTELVNSLKGFPELKVMKNRSVYPLKSENICLYTPGDYVTSVEQVTGIIKSEKKKLNEQ